MTNRTKERAADCALLPSRAPGSGSAPGDHPSPCRLDGIGPAEGERAFRALVQNLSDVVSIHDAAGVFLYVAPSVERVLGYKPEALIGSPALALIHPDDASRFEHDFRQVVDRTNQHVPTELRVRHANGAWLALETVGNNLLDDPQVGGIVLTSRDVTERNRQALALQASEEKLRTILASSPHAITVVDLAGQIVECSQAAVQLHGFSDKRELIGAIALSLIAPVHRLEAMEKLNQMASDGIQRSAEYEFLRRDGGKFAGRISVSVLRDSSGEPVGFVGMTEDVTGRKDHEREREALITVATALRTARTLADMVPIILDQTLALLNADGSSLSSLDDATGDTLVQQARGVLAPGAGRRIPAGLGVTAPIIETGKPFVISDAQSSPHIHMKEIFCDCPAVAAVPLATEEQTVGVLMVCRRTPFCDGDVRLLSAIGDMAANAIQRATLHEQTEQRLKYLTSLRAVDMAISASLDLRIILNVIADQAVSLLVADAAQILLLDAQTHSLTHATGRGLRTRALERAAVRLGEGAAGRAALERTIISVIDVRDDQRAAVRTAQLAAEGFVSLSAAPLLAKGEVKGVLEIFHRRVFSPDPEWLELAEMLAGQAAIAIDNSELFDSLQRSNSELGLAYDATIEGWSRALDLRDKETEGHTRRVTELALRLAREMSIGEAELVHMRRGALLHDIGKMGIPDRILLKPGPLSDEEMDIMRRHPVIARELLWPIGFLRPALDIPFSHHEKWDGSGYPLGLRGERIPLIARIFAIADVYDALCSDRPYRKAWTPVQAVEYIRAQTGKHFDPQVAQAFEMLNLLAQP